jgi:antitoxin (DNA-binding transcriptional repressor) of toxin-antitoxin stability system
MKSISIDRSPRLLRDLTAAAHGNIVTLTRKGRPVAYVLTAPEYDEEDIGYMTDPDFWRMIRERRESDEGIPLEGVIAELEERERAEQSRRHRRNGARSKKPTTKRKRSNGST